MKLRTHRSSPLLTLCALAATAACGSTVQHAGAPPTDSLGDLPTTQHPPGPVSPGPGSVTDPGVPSRPGGPHKGPPVGGTSGGTTGTTGGVAQPVGVSGPGVTDKVLYVGLTYEKNGEAANQAFGTEAIDAGDSRNYYNAVIADVNKAGGVLGRRVVPVYFGIEPTSAQTTDQQAQAACSHWTDDNKVFAILGGGNDVVRRCATAEGVFHLVTEWSTSSAADYQRHPNYVEVSSLSKDREGGVTVAGLERLGYLKGLPRIGLITWDSPTYVRAMKSAWLPALAQRGIGSDKVIVQYATVPQQFNALGDAAASVNNAIVKFRGAGIQHVIIPDGPAGVFGGTGLTLMFIRSASSQKYFPRYGMNSTNSPQAVLDTDPQLWSQTDVPGSVAVEWMGHQSDRPNAAQARCFAVMRAAGVTMDNVNAEASASTACDLVYFLRASLTAAPRGPLTVRAAMQGVAALGRSYASPLTFATYFSATRHDGVARARLSRLRDEEGSCHCYEWVGPAYELD